jgi:hypothetical protein
VRSDVNIEKFINDSTSKIDSELKQFKVVKSGGWFKKIQCLNILFHTCHVMKGRCFINLPENLKRTKAIINPIKCNMECFKWSILAGEIKTRHDILKNYIGKEGLYNWSLIEYPTKMEDIDLFEKSNGNVSLDIFSFNEENRIIRIRKSPISKERHHNLLFVMDRNGVGHYCYIKNFDRLISKERRNKTMIWHK